MMLLPGKFVDEYSPRVPIVPAGYTPAPEGILTSGASWPLPGITHFKQTSIH
jgi:hypothetical protein